MAREDSIMMRVVFALVLALGSVTALTQAQAAWPDKPVHMIVPLPAGSAVDTVARLIGQKLSKRIGQPLIMENRPGASGSLATEAVAKAAPDGYTLGMATTTTHVTNLILNKNLNYDPIKNFVPVALIGIVPYVLEVSPKLPVKSVAELIALAKKKPGMLSYSSVGAASLAHLAAEQLATMEGIKLNHVPYRSSAPATLDLAEGRIDITFGVLGSSLPLIKAGKVHPLAVATAKRAPSVPDVPTMAEAGVPNFDVSLWFAIMAPAGTPKPIVDRLNREINEILKLPDVDKALKLQAITVELSTPDQMRDRMRADIERWRAVAQKAGIKPQ
jgi:tripartite-type tricarboxylate transporter receptor subunit TctC